MFTEKQSKIWVARMGCVHYSATNSLDLIFCAIISAKSQSQKKYRTHYGPSTHQVLHVDVETSCRAPSPGIDKCVLCFRANRQMI